MKKYLYKWVVKDGDKVSKGQIIGYYVNVKIFEEVEWHESKQPIFSSESGYLERKIKEGRKSYFTDVNKLFYIHKEGLYKKENSPKKSIYTYYFYWQNVNDKLKTTNRNEPLSVVEHFKFEGDFVNENELILTIGYTEAINHLEEYDETYEIVEIRTPKSGYLHIGHKAYKTWVFDGKPLFQVLDKQEYKKNFGGLRGRFINKSKYVFCLAELVFDE